MIRQVPGTEQPVKRTIAVDFDGVIHAYTSPWRGSSMYIDDAPVPGSIEWLTAMVETHDVFVFSCRLLDTKRDHVANAMRVWLLAHGCPRYVAEALIFTHEKPHADVYLDDRAMRFEGTFPTREEIAAASVPWNKRGGA